MKRKNKRHIVDREDKERKEQGYASRKGEKKNSRNTVLFFPQSSVNSEQVS